MVPGDPCAQDLGTPHRPLGPYHLVLTQFLDHMPELGERYWVHQATYGRMSTYSFMSEVADWTQHLAQQALETAGTRRRGATTMTWTREDGYVFTLDRLRVSSRVLRIEYHGTIVFYKQYGWWENSQAEQEAEELARLMGAERRSSSKVLQVSASQQSLHSTNG